MKLRRKERIVKRKKRQRERERRRGSEREGGEERREEKKGELKTKMKIKAETKREEAVIVKEERHREGERGRDIIRGSESRLRHVLIELGQWVSPPSLIAHHTGRLYHRLLVSMYIQ